MRRGLRVDPALLLILLLALALRLALWWLPLHQLANDEHEYVRVARDLLAGRGWQLYEHYPWLRAPLYPLFLAASLALSGGDLHGAALPNLSLSLLNVGLAYAICKANFANRAMALLAATLAALLLTFSTFASLYMLETLFATLLAGALLLLLHYRQRPGLKLAALAGAVLGLAALTRSLALPLLPLGCLFLLIARIPDAEPLGLRRLWAELRRSMAAMLVFVGCCCLVIAPWTLRNYLAYGRVIPIETGLAYNTWAFNEPREDLDAIARTLSAIPNPGDRADFANAQGRQRLREDPAILLRKIDQNWFALWRVKPIEDRFIQQDYYSDVGSGYFVAALLGDDALILLILVAASVGLVLAPGRSSKLLLGGWVVGTTLSVLLTHGEARYRHALLPALLPYAAWALQRLWQLRQAAFKPSGSALQVLGAWLLAACMAYTFLSAYPWQWAEQRLVRGLLQLRGELALRRGDVAGALADYAAAAQADPDSVDALLLLGRTYAAQGQLAAAEEAYRSAWALRPTYIPASTLLGDLLRRTGDSAGARRAFAGAYAPAQQISDWAWSNLQPPPVQRIDVGDGLDLGYVTGVYPAEQQQGANARWTNGEARLRLAGGRPWLLTLRLAAPRPDGQPVAAQLCRGSVCQQLRVGANWRSYSLVLPPMPGADQEIVLRSERFVSAQDGRALGLLIDWVRLSSIAGAVKRSSAAPAME